MCFQGYVHWLCGHTSLYQDSCPDALNLQLPFHLKISCPAYTISTRSPQSYCGIGHFYCAKTPDGIKLDHFHAAHTSAVEEIARMEDRLYAKDGLKEYGQQIGNAILRSGGDKEDCERDERIRAVFEEVGSLRGEVEGVKLREIKLKGMIERAKVYLKEKQRDYQIGGDEAGTETYQTTLYETGPHHPGRHHPGQHHPGPHQTVQHHHVQHPQRQSSHKKRKKELSPDKPSPAIRRSSRVRTKKVTYAESESETTSRTPSPEKSDAADSQFSPSKEAVQGRKSKIERSSSNSLVDKISDWQKREMTKTLHESMRQNNLSCSSSIPKSETREWNTNPYNIAAKIPPQNLAVQAGQQDCKMNRYDSDFTFPRPTSLKTRPKITDYHPLRRSFSATTKLVPHPSLPETMDSEPRKRRVPAAASPPLPLLPIAEETSSKRSKKTSLFGTKLFPTLTPAVAAAAPIPAERIGMRRESSSVEEEQEKEGKEDLSMQEEVPTLEGGLNANVDVDVDEELSDIDWNFLEDGVFG